MHRWRWTYRLVAANKLKNDTKLIFMRKKANSVAAFLLIISMDTGLNNNTNLGTPAATIKNNKHRQVR
jgi:hypothetical protein